MCTMGAPIYADIDVMHQDHNMGESIIITCMGFPDKKKTTKKLERIWQSFVTVKFLRSKKLVVIHVLHFVLNLNR
jgi:hypothetical protein